MNYEENKAERERQKELQRHEEQRRIRKEKMKSTVKYLAVGVIVIAIVTGLVFLILNAKVSPQGEKSPLQGREHIVPGQEHDPYNSNPPTSGWHNGSTATWGFHSTPVTDEEAIHNLEHGGIWISYRDLTDEELNLLKKFASKHPQSVLLSPRSLNESRISLAAWTRLMKLDTVDMEQVELFYKGNKNNSPEPFAGK